MVKLANGTHTLRSLANGEKFHPVIGPVAEAEALYLRQLHLVERMRHHEGEFVIWDVGLGAAANVLTVLQATRGMPCPIRILSFDCTLEPLRFAMSHREEMGYFEGYETGLDELMARGSCRFTKDTGPVEWELHLADFPALLAQREAAQFAKPHAILFDAYSPAKNPAMWTEPLFTRLFQLLDPGRACLLPTYSRSTMLRTTLLLAGFFVGRGHATGEKEETTIAANRRELVTELLDREWLRRARRSTSAEPLREASYRQAPLSRETWERLQQHPQFK